MATTRIRKFNKQDWALLGGAEKFSDGSEPFIVDEFEYADTMAIADRDGLQLITPDNEYHMNITTTEGAWNSKLAEGFFKNLINDIQSMTEEEMVSYCSCLGFRPVFE